MNSCSLTWVSYCSSDLEFHPNGESAMRWFSEFFVTFLGFQRKEEADNNALITNRPYKMASPSSKWVIKELTISLGPFITFMLTGISKVL